MESFYDANIKFNEFFQKKSDQAFGMRIEHVCEFKTLSNMYSKQLSSKFVPSQKWKPFKIVWKILNLHRTINPSRLDYTHKLRDYFGIFVRQSIQ